jgi:hypothetical protein
MAVNVPGASDLEAQIGRELVALRDDFQKLVNRNAYINQMGGTNFLTAAPPNGLGMQPGDAAALVAALGNHANLATQYTGGAQAPAMDYKSNGSPFWGGQ